MCVAKLVCCIKFIFAVLQNRCRRDQCKFFHPPTHIKQQLISAGKQFGAMMSSMYSMPGGSYYPPIPTVVSWSCKCFSLALFPDTLSGPRVSGNETTLFHPFSSPDSLSGPRVSGNETTLFHPFSSPGSSVTEYSAHYWCRWADN